MYQDNKHSLSNKKRIESLKHKKDQLKTQQQLIKTALSSLDSKRVAQKRIVFGNSDDEDIPEVINVSGQREFDEKQTQHKSALFLSSDSENEGNQSPEENLFRIRPQFEGRKGQKLLNIHSNINKDKRFQLNERFLESDDQSSEGENELPDNDAEDGEVSAMVSEKEKNLNILQDVLGIQLPLKPSYNPRKTSFRDPSSLRFDPTSEESSKFEIKKEEKKVTQMKPSIKEPEPAPPTSKDRYYEVSSSLKNAFTKDAGFSLLKSFGSHEEYHNEDTPKGTEEYTVKTGVFSNKMTSVFWDENPYFDSSGEDSKADQKQGIARLEERIVPQQIEQFKGNTEGKSFFFLSGNEQCLKDGIEFFHRKKSLADIQKEWEEVQPQLMQMLHTKARKAARTKMKSPRMKGKKNSEASYLKKRK